MDVARMEILAYSLQLSIQNITVMFCDLHVQSFFLDNFGFESLHLNILHVFLLYPVVMK